MGCITAGGDGAGTINRRLEMNHFNNLIEGRTKKGVSQESIFPGVLYGKKEKKTCLGCPLCRVVSSGVANFCSRQQKYVEMPAVCCVEGGENDVKRVAVSVFFVRTSYLHI